MMHLEKQSRGGFVTVLFGGHARDALEIAVKGCWFGEAKHIGCFLKCLCGTSLNKALGLCRHVLFNPFGWGETIGGFADNLAKMFGSEVQLVSVELDLARLTVVLYHQVAETVEDFCLAFFCPIFVLITTIAVKKLIAHGQLRQQRLIAMGQFLFGVIGDDDELVNNGHQVRSLLVSQRK